MENSIIKLYNSYFPIDKIRYDLFEYLDEIMPDSLHGDEYIFEIFEIDSPELSKEIRVRKSDTLTTYKIQSSYEFQTDLYYYISIGIGKFKARDVYGLYKVEKCDAVLKYNHDLSLYDIVFSYSNISEMN